METSFTERFGLGVVTLVAEHQGQIIQTGCHVRVLVAVRLAEDCQSFAVERFCLIIITPPAVDARQIEQADGHTRVVIPEMPALDLQRLAVSRLGGAVLLVPTW